MPLASCWWIFSDLQAKIAGYITATSSAASPRRQGTSVRTTNPSFPSGMGTATCCYDGRAVLAPWWDPSPFGTVQPQLLVSCSPSGRELSRALETNCRHWHWDGNECCWELCTPARSHAAGWGGALPVPFFALIFPLVTLKEEGETSRCLSCYQTVTSVRSCPSPAQLAKNYRFVACLEGAVWYPPSTAMLHDKWNGYKNKRSPRTWNPVHQEHTNSFVSTFRNRIIYWNISDCICIPFKQHVFPLEISGNVLWAPYKDILEDVFNMDTYLNTHRYVLEAHLFLRLTLAFLSFILSLLSQSVRAMSLSL